GGLLAPVDRVEVAGRAGIADQGGPVDREGLGRQAGAHLDVGELDRHDDLAVPRATSVDTAVTTSSPSTVRTSPLTVSMSLPAMARIDSTELTTRSTSPAWIGRRGRAGGDRSV